jgi:hypothetical protein
MNNSAYDKYLQILERTEVSAHKSTNQLLKKVYDEMREQGHSYQVLAAMLMRIVAVYQPDAFTK